MDLASRDRHAPAEVTTYAVAIIFTAYMAVVFGFGLYLFSLLASDMRASLGFGYQTIGMITAAAQVSFLFAAVMCARLTKRFGDGQVIVFAVFLAGILLSVVPLAEMVLWVAVTIALLGACAALMVIPTVGVISKTVAFRNRSRVNGLISSGTAYGQFAAGLVAPWVMQSSDWRSVWLVIGLVSIGVALTGLIGLRFFAPTTFSKSAKDERPPRKVSSNSLFNRTNITLWALLAASGMACGPWQNFLATFLREERGYVIATLGQLWSMVGFLGLFSGFAMGLLADRIGIRRALALCYVLVGISAILVAVHGSIATLQAATICFGLSFFAVYGLIPGYITKSVPSAQATSVFAGANICLGLGTAFGNLTAGTIPVLSGSLQHVYICISAVALIAAIGTLTLPDERKSDG